MPADSGGQRVVLLGLGHTNIEILRRWRHEPRENTELICLSDFPFATYSGMLPGVLAGQYRPAQMQVDLEPLCASAGARLIVDAPISIDRQNRLIQFSGRPDLSYDLLSINVGSVTPVPDQQRGPPLSIKPMQTFLRELTQRLESWATRQVSILVSTHASGGGNRPRGSAASCGGLDVVIVGCGAAGAEIACCLPPFLRRTLGDVPFLLRVIHADDRPLSDASPRLSRRVSDLLRERGVETIWGRRVVAVDATSVRLDDETSWPADLVIWTTGASVPPLLHHIDLPRDDRGFLLTRPTLQAVGDDAVFVVGDAGTLRDRPAPKSGVFAVRQGPVLWQNITRLLQGEPLVDFQPQPRFLKLLNLGDGRALGEYRGVTFSGRWVWSWKDWIDRRFITRYQSDG